MPSSNFIIDIVVTSLNVPGVVIDEPQKLIVEARVVGKGIFITSSRINVTDFKAGGGVELVLESSALRENLENNGLIITVRYKGFTMGAGTIILPDEVIDTITDDMSDLIHADSCELIRGGKLVGTIDILFRMVIKCEETTQAVEHKGFHPSIARNISPQDILFVVGEPKVCPTPTDPCPDVLESEEGDDRLFLDLLRFRSVNQRVTTQTIEDTYKNRACCELKKLTLEYGDIIDKVAKQVGISPEQPCTYAQDLDKQLDSSPCQPCKQKLPEIPHEIKVPFKPYTPGPDALAEGFAYDNAYPIPIGDGHFLNPETPKPIRFCPVCLNSISWLPRYAACPKCGVKPTPIFDEKLEEKLNADEILKECLGERKAVVDDDYCEDPCTKALKDKDNSDISCRCTCKGLKFCAHCRIRKLCSDIFHSHEKKTEECPEVVPKSNEDFRIVSTKPPECRPYLTRVFSELSHLYDVKETMKKESQLALKCSQLLVKSKANMTAEKPEMEAKEPTAGIMERIYPGNKIGHKNCLNLPGIVPRHHGWAWASSKEARKHGWRPGAIRRPIDGIMKFFLANSSEENAFNQCKRLAEALKEEEREMPVLTVKKKNGEIFITLRPLGSSKLNMKPITFKIVKSDLAVALREIKRRLKSMGFPKCTCHKTLMLCECRHYMEKKQIEKVLRKLCENHGMPMCGDKLILTDTSESEVEFDVRVTPPAGTNKPLAALKPRTINHGTQTSKADLKVQPLYPMPWNPYYRTYDCAVGDRYTGTAFGAPGEKVFEDGAFGFFGGGPHGKTICPGGRPKLRSIWGAGTGGPMRLGSRGPTAMKGFPGGGKTGPYAEPKKEGAGKPIPVKMPERFLKAAKEAVKAQAEAKKKEEEKRKRGTDIMKYLESQGKVGPVKGPDGLTDEQRRRRKLTETAVPPLCDVKRRGKPYDPCTPICYDDCGMSYDPRYIC
ncbi:uncharacterized protein LOC115621139 [Scaptodrosophila lebanonensis]|uniref:Uncharacterized protein LOC115621139 n=1 Tax=Drosophila lebanonensis TaxID=7225 RepID=A0A6J2T0X7_DROLE|nr:uncharacterized protein LOC115621139 [Scaptodrosophila lebanonensis]